MKKRILSLALALSLSLGLLPTAAWAAKPMDSEAGGYTETAETPPERPEQPRVSPRTAQDAGETAQDAPQLQAEEPDAALREAGYSVVLTLPGEWDSCAWQLWAGEAEGWTSLDVQGPTLPLFKEMFVSCAFRCVAEKDGAKTVSAPYAYDEAALETPAGAGASLLASAKEPWQASEYVAVAAAGSSGKCFDLYGIEDGSYYKTTYSNSGYTIASEVDGTKLRWNAGPNTDVSMGESLTGRFGYDIVYGGRYAKITYQVTNNGSTEKTFKIGSSGDVMIDKNDKAEVVGTDMGLQMDDKAGKKFNLAVPNATTRWYGGFSSAYSNTFTDLADKTVPYNGDSGMAWSWTGTVKPGKTWTRSALVGVGELPTAISDPTITIAYKNGRDFAIPGETFTVSGTAAGASEVYIDLDGTEYKAAVSGGRFSTEVPAPDDAPEGELDLQAWAVDNVSGAISNTVPGSVDVKHPLYFELTSTETSVMEGESLSESWYEGFIKSTNGAVTHHPYVNTDALGEQRVTYTASRDNFDPVTKTLTVRVLPRPAELGSTAVGENFTLSAEMVYTGGLTYIETGFVYGSFQNPNLNFNDGIAKTSSPVNTKGGQLSATATGLIEGVTYYARAYAKTADGTVIYGTQSGAFGPGVPAYGTFHIKNNGNNTFTITRTGGGYGVQKVYYRTVSGSAVGIWNGGGANQYHFHHTGDVLTFAAGDGESQTVTVTEYGNSNSYNGERTQYSNADRTYQMEIHRVEGGAGIGTRFAQRNMGHDMNYTVSADQTPGVGPVFYDVAYMARDTNWGSFTCRYLPGDPITISLFFDEIVDASKSTLTGDSCITTNWGTFRYAGGAGTNILYFTGTVPYKELSNSTGNLKVDELNCAGQIKDMAGNPCAGAMPSSNSTTVKVGGNPVPTVTVGTITNSSGTLTANITAENAATLEYAWTQSSATPTSGWRQMEHNTGGEVTTRQTSGTWYLHAQATNVDGARKTDVKSFSIPAPGQPGALVLPTLTANVSDGNSDWAKQRTITLTKSPGDATVTVLTPGSSTPATVLGTTYTATANGTYTFKLTSGSETVTAMATVSKLDLTDPTVTIDALPDITYVQPVTLTVHAADAESRLKGSPSGTWSSGSRTVAATFTGSDGVYTSTSPNETGTWTLSVTVTDNVDRTAAKSSADYELNLNVPTVTVTEGATNPNGSVNYTYSVDMKGLTVQSIQLPDGTITTDTSGSFILTEPGTYYVVVSDTVGHVVRSAPMEVAEPAPDQPPVDGQPPEVRLTPSTEEWVSEETGVTITVNAYDNIEPYFQATWKDQNNRSSTIGLSRDDDAMMGDQAKTGSFHVSQNGTYIVTAKDGRDNAGTAEIEIANIDPDDPTITDLTGNPPAWTPNSATISFKAADSQSGVKTVTVEKGSTNDVAVTNSNGNCSFVADSNGTYTITVTDGVGYTATQTVTVAKIDKTVPTISVSGGTTAAASLELTVDAKNSGGSGVTATVSKDGGEAETVAGGKCTVTQAGTYVFTATTGAGLTASQTVSVCSITFDENGGADVTDQIVVSGGKATEPAITRTGYTFGGWKNGTAAWNFNTGVTANTTLTAQWTLDAPTVELIADKTSAAYTGDPVITLTATPTHPVAGLSYTYKWYKGAAELTGKTDSTLALTTVDDSGAYTVKVTASDGTLTSAEVESAAQSVTISKTAPVLSDLKAGDITYGDALTASTPSGKATDPKTGDDVPGRWSWTASDASTTYPTVVNDSGKTEYSVTFTPSDSKNYGPATATVKLTVNKATLIPSVNTVAGKVYDGNTSTTGTLSLSGAKFDQAPEAKGTFTFNSANVTEANAVDVSDIALTGDWGGNYKLDPTSLSGVSTTARITQKEVTLTWNGADGLVYNGSPVNVTATAGSLVGEDACTVTVTGGTETDVGTYTATAAGLSNSNYALPTAKTQKYTIAKATPALSALSATAITYGDALSASEPSGAANHPTTNVDVPGAWSWTSADAGTTYPTVVNDSGKTEYSVTFTPEDGDNYSTSTANVKLTVNKATLTPSVDTVAGKVYNGSAATTGTITLSGVKFNQAPEAKGTFTFNSANVTEANAVDVGDIALTGDWGGNYMLSDTSLSGISTTARITRKEVTLTWNGTDGLVYNGSPVNVTATAGDLAGEDICAVTVEGGTETNAGTYTATATGLSNSNYVLPTAKTQAYTIAKCPVTFTVTGNDLEYHHGGHPSADVTAPGLTKDTDFTVSYRQTGAVIEPHFSGTYDVMAELTNDNYKFDGQADGLRELKVGELIIRHASYEGAITWPTASNAITYGQPLSEVKFAGGSGSTEGGEGTFAWDAPDSFPDASTTKAVMVFDPEDPEYDNVEYDVAITVNKATLTPSVATVADKVFDGGTATNGTIKLAGAKFTDAPAAEGTFNFVDKNAQENKAVNVTAIALTDNWGDNYALSTETLSAIPTAAKITPKPVTLTWDGYQDLVYNGKSVNVTATAGSLVEEDACTVTVDDEGRATHAGDHTATATALSDPNYKLPEGVTKAYTIAPKPVTLLWHNMIQPYTGTDRTPKAVTEVGSESAVTLQGVVPQDDGTADVVFTVTQNGQSAQAVNAGTYTVTGAMKPGSNYVVTGYNTAQLTVQKAPVTFAITDNALKEGEPRHAATVNSDPANVPFTVVYKDRDGQVADPETQDLKAGAYTIWATINDGNYHHAGSATGGAAQIGVFTVYAQEPPKKYAVTFEAADPEDETGADGGVIGALSGSTEPLAAAEVDTLRVLPKCSFACTGYAFAGWELDGLIYPAGAAYTQEAQDVTFTAQWAKAVHTVEGVVDQDGKPISDVQVTLMLGANVIAQRHTDAAGKFRFENIAPGLYNLVVTKDGVTKTVAVTIVDQDEARNITLPTHKTNSVVVVTPGTPNVVVGNLENNFTPEDKDLAAEDVSTEVEYKFTVQQEPENEQSADQQAIQEAAGRAIPELYLELKLEKTVTEGTSVTTSVMPESNVLIESVIPLPAELQGKHRYTVIRCHGEGADAQVEELEEEVPNDAGEYFVVNDDQTVLTIYARKFSTYAVAYSDRHSGTIAFGSGTRPVCARGEACPIAKFHDASADAWYHDGVHYCLEKGLMVGTSDTTFEPETPTSRAMIATILWRLQGSKVVSGPIPYPDVAEGTWYTEAVRWATREGIVEGYGTGKFGPADPITREQLATMLYRYEQKYGGGGFTGMWMFLLDFHDAAKVSDWANEAMHWMTMKKVITGKDGKLLDPQGQATRAEAAAMLQRYIQLDKE